MTKEAGRVTGPESTAGTNPGGIKLQADSLRDQALRVIRARIISGAMRPGELYALGATASELGVSVTPVREAVLELARERLVELARNRGFRVREMSEHELNEIVEFRKIIEVGAVRLVAERKLLDQGKGLQELARATEKYAAAGDWVGFLDSDRDFHLGIMGLLANERLIQVVGSLRDQSRLYGLDYVAGTESLTQSTHEHAALLTAIINGRADDAAVIMDGHLQHARGIWAGKPEPGAGKPEPGAGQPEPGAGQPEPARK
jgi:DNA-binding GntR family transcriptional regulator